jgi:hypothetical protein
MISESELSSNDTRSVGAVPIGNVTPVALAFLSQITVTNYLKVPESYIQYGAAFSF